MNKKVRRVRIPVASLRLGMYVAELDRPWLDSPFTIHGFTLRSEQHLRLLQQLCRYVYVDVKVTATAATKEKPAKVVYQDAATLAQELPRAKATHRQAKNVVKGLLGSLRVGQSFDSTPAKKAVKACVDSVIANPSALMWLSLLKNVDEYTAEHSLNVCLLSIVLGRAEGLNRADLEEVGLCGLLHDMGKAKTPLEILNKEGALTEEEFEIMKAHTTEGYKILKPRKDISAQAAEVAYSHHERLNGRGYPRGLNAENISYFSRIVAIADTYDAITSNRCYSPAKTALEGLQILMGARGTHFDPDLVTRFIDCIGIYPAGSLAELSTGQVGIVLPVRENPNKPQILIVRDADKKPCDEQMISLALDPLDSAGKPIKIRNLLSDGMFGIDLKAYHDSANAKL